MKQRISFLLACVFLCLTGCRASGAEQTFFAMDTVMSVQVSGRRGPQAVAAAREAVERLDGLLSRTDSDSQIARLNTAAGDGAAVAVDPDVAELLAFSQEIARQLPGDFDITIAPVMDAWGFTTEERHVPAPDALARLNYRSKKALTGQVRIVAFPGADCCACCGTHVRRAGEVGIIKVLSCQKFREGVRLEILCGSRAYRYLSQVYDQDRAVAQLLSVKPQDTLAAAERQAEELAAAKQRMTELEDQLFSLRAQALTDRGDLLLLEPPTRPDGARKLADAAAKASGGLAAVFAGAESSYVYALVQADGADISPLVKRLNAALSGRGGGRNGFAQGSVQADRTAIYDFFRKEGIECPTC